MGITVRHDPSFASIGQAALAAGYGNYLQRQDELAAQQAQQAEENRLRAAQMAIGVRQNERNFAYGVQQDIANRQMQGFEIQQRGELRRADQDFQQAQDARQFDQQKALLDQRQIQEERMLQQRAEAEAEARSQKQLQDRDDFAWELDEKDRRKQAALDKQISDIENDPGLEPAERPFLIQEARDKAGLSGPRLVSKNEQAQREYKARQFLTDDGRPAIWEGKPGEGRLRYLDEDGENGPKAKAAKVAKEQQSAWEAAMEKHETKARTHAVNRLTYAKSQVDLLDKNQNKKKALQDAMGEYDQHVPPPVAPDRARFFPQDPAQQQPLISTAPRDVSQLPAPDASPPIHPPEAMNSPPIGDAPQAVPDAARRFQPRPDLAPLHQSLVNTLGPGVDSQRFEQDASAADIRGLKTGTRDGAQQLTANIETKAARVREIMAQYGKGGLDSAPQAVQDEYHRLAKDIAVYFTRGQ